VATDAAATAPRKRRRPVLIGLIASGVLLFLVISALLARWLSVENAERDDIFAVLKAQAAGDPGGMLSGLSRCRENAACTANVMADARTLRRPGTVHILNLQSPTAYTLTSSTGTTRVAWSVPGRLPVVQCVLVRRNGNFLSGISVTLLALSRPIGNTADC
jgi:hypothetical protein